MCWKRVKKIFSNTGSITTQLTLFYTASTVVIITLVYAFASWAMVHVLNNAGQQFLTDEISILQNILISEPNKIAALQQEVVNTPQSLQSSVYHYYIRILDNQQKIVVATPKMGEQIPQAAFTQSTQWWQADSGEKYLLKQSTVGKENGLIQIALDVTYQQAVIDNYRKTAGVILLGGAIVALLFGYLISRRGLRRLYELTDTTRKITANTLQQRIESTYWPAELKDLGVEYNQMLNRIESSMARLTGLADDLAHELRAPITNLIGEAEIALSRDSTQQDYQHLVQSSLEELNRLNSIIENLLFLARTENPHLDLQKTTLNVRAEIEVMCRFYQALAEDKNIKIAISGSATLNANSIMFRRMIGNLLSNAIQYSESDTHITITIREADNDTVKITVCDTGTGIASEHIPNLFQRFYRVDSARAQHSGGTGLGLAIVKSIIELHRGTICIKSEINLGTTVVLAFPIRGDQ